MGPVRWLFHCIYTLCRKHCSLIKNKNEWIHSVIEVTTSVLRTEVYVRDLNVVYCFDNAVSD